MSATLDCLSADSERLFWRLTTKADDYGRFDADPRVLLSACFPRKVDRLKPSSLLRWRNELAQAGLIDLYEVEERCYLVFRTWFTYQRKRESRPKYPDPAAGRPCDPDAASRGDLPPVAARMRAIGSRESRVESREMSSAAVAATPPPVAATAVSGDGAPDVASLESSGSSSRGDEHVDATEHGPAALSTTARSPAPVNGRGDEHQGPEHGPAALSTATREILDFLNRKADKHFQPTRVNLDLIAARLRDGATADQCRAVIARKVRSWKGDPKMDQYLRPSTLFNREKFSQYQGELPATAFQPPESRLDA